MHSMFRKIIAGEDLKKGDVIVIDPRTRRGTKVKTLETRILDALKSMAATFDVGQNTHSGAIGETRRVLKEVELKEAGDVDLSDLETLADSGKIKADSFLETAAADLMKALEDELKDVAVMSIPRISYCQQNLARALRQMK